MTDNQHVKAGDTILIDDTVHPGTHNINSVYNGKKFKVTRVDNSHIYVSHENEAGPNFFFRDEFTIVSDQKCPECKGTGKVLLFMFESPCSLCSSQRK